MSLNGQFQGLAGLVETALGGIDHGQVVEWLRQFGLITSQGRKDLDGLGQSAHLGEQDAFQEASVPILGFFAQVLVELGEGAVQVVLEHQGLDVVQIAGLSTGHAQTEQGRTEGSNKGFARGLV